MHVKQDKTVKSFTLRPAALHQKCSRVAFIDRLVPCCEGDGELSVVYCLSGVRNTDFNSSTSQKSRPHITCMKKVVL